MLHFHRVKKQLPLVPHRFLQDRWLCVEGAALGRAKHSSGPWSMEWALVARAILVMKRKQCFVYLCICAYSKLYHLTVWQGCPERRCCINKEHQVFTGVKFGHWNANSNTTTTLHTHYLPTCLSIPKLTRRFFSCTAVSVIHPTATWLCEMNSLPSSLFLSAKIQPIYT